MASYDDTATVSGSVVGFSNGADSVPLKNWLVTLPASLDGYSEVNGVQTGKNLLPDTNYMTNYFSVADNGVVSQITTSASYAWSYANCIFKTTLPPGTYTAIEELVTDVTNASHGVQVFNSSNVRITSVSGGRKTAGTYSSIFTLSEKTDIGIVCKLYDGTAKLYIVSGSSASSYEPYTEPTSHTANLGRTVYGGTPDLVNGTGTETHGKVVFDGTEGTGGTPSWTMISVTQGTMFRITVSNKATTSATNTLCSYYTPTAQAQRADGTVSGSGTNLDIIDNRFSSVDDFKAWLVENPVTLVYELATPTSFTFDPVAIETSKGSNTFWSDQGNTELTYYKDGYGFTSVTVHKETPEGEPVEQTVKLHKIVYGGLVDVIKGKAEPKNLIPFEPISEYTYLGITYTQYSDGTVKINGTASGGLSFYRVIPNGSDGVHFKSGVAYTLSGCVGGSSTTYQLDLRVGNSVVGYYKNAIDYGRGYSFTATEDSVAYPLICVRNGTTVNNVIISPMVEVGSSASEYAPHFDPFTFPPISMETDEGENTLYADQGDSAITYRKAVD